MTSGQPLEINRNNAVPGSASNNLARHMIRLVIAGLLSATGFIHWYLPVVHKMAMPNELTEGIIIIPHALLHILFDMNGVGYFILVALVVGLLPLSPQYQRWLYIVVVGYAALTILAWLLLSEATERGMLDYADKLIEVFIIILAAQMTQRGTNNVGILRKQ